jgi:hypothetical protein
MITIINTKKPIQKYSTTCLTCKCEFTFDKLDIHSITDEGQGRTFEVVTCPECQTDISTWFWQKLN